MTLAPEAVRSMFDRIAPVYDAMNRVMTAGLDLRWRRLAAAAVVRPGDRVLDAACGTGDFALADLRAGALEVTGLDFSPRMLERARRKAPGLEWVEGDLLALPFDDGSFDAATVGFGVRNVADLELGAARAAPRAAARRPARDPRDHAGRAARCGRSSRSGSTGSCRCSAGCFPAAARTRTSRRRSRGSRGAEELAALLERAGFAEVRFRLLAGSIVALHTGSIGGRSER